MQVVIPGQANTLKADLDNRSTGAPITAGTVTFYLRALSGANAGKWFRASDATWQVALSSAGAGVHVDDGLWTCTIAAAAWSYGVLYVVKAKESGDLHVPYSEQVVPSLAVGVVGTGGTAWTYTLTDSVTGLAIADATVWVTNDAAGANVLYRDTTDASGQVTFYLPAGTWYIWRDKAGYEFTNPDTETIA